MTKQTQLILSLTVTSNTKPLTDFQMLESLYIKYKIIK